MRLFTTISILVFASYSGAQSQDSRLTAVERYLEKLENTRLAAIDKRLEKLDRRTEDIGSKVEELLSRMGGRPNRVPEARSKAREPVKTVEKSSADSYSSAYLRALAENKPLIVWVGGNFCPG